MLDEMNECIFLIDFEFTVWSSLLEGKLLNY